MHKTGTLSKKLLPALTCLLMGCSQGMRSPERRYGPEVQPPPLTYPQEVHRPLHSGALDTDLRDIHQSPVGIACTTCHGSASQPRLIEPGVAQDFHRGIQLSHGNLSCNSCHSRERNLLHLADGQKVNFDETLRLCAQCHGQQHRDYGRGAHGGMSGYWDRRRGKQVRNTCIDCHSPHKPAYQPMHPVHPPRDRFLEWHPEEKAHE